MDVLQDMFAGFDPLGLHRAFTQAGGDIEIAIEIILAEIDEQQSKELLRNSEPAPLNIKADGPPIQRPLLSPSSSADSFKALKISDHDANDWDDLVDDFIAPLEHHRHPPPSPQQDRRHEVVLDEDDEPVQQPGIDECLAGVLTIFPDACPDHIKEVYKENHLLQGGKIIDFIANKLAEDGYPRTEAEPKPGLKRKRPVAEEEGGKEYEADYRDPVTSEYLSFV